MIPQGRPPLGLFRTVTRGVPLATQLMSGKPLGAIAAESGSSKATVRSQLRSILKKIKVERQADLFLVLAEFHAPRTGKPLRRRRRHRQDS